MPDHVNLTAGYMAAPRNDEALYVGLVRDGGRRIHTWASSDRITLVSDLAIGAVRAEDITTPDRTTYSVRGDHSLRLTVDQAEALIVDLALAVLASRAHAGEPWHEAEVAPGLLRAPTTTERG